MSFSLRIITNVKLEVILIRMMMNFHHTVKALVCNMVLNCDLQAVKFQVNFLSNLVLLLLVTFQKLFLLHLNSIALN